MPAKCYDREAIKKLPCVAVMSSGMRSMESTIPFGFGFAVVNKTGTVLFHSDKDSNQQLKLFEEVDDPGQLIVALNVGHGQVDAEYQGSEYRFNVRSINVDGPGWHLVTFYDKDLYELFLVEFTGATALAWSLWFGMLLLLAGCY